MARSSVGRILVFGANGQVGHELLPMLSGIGETVGLDRSDADLSDPESLRAVVRSRDPRVIVNAAAYTAVDKAEGEPELARAVNATSPGVLAEEAERLGAMLVHYSTDYVFDGTKATPYDEQDAPNPLSIYGSTKLEGERLVTSSCRRHVIFRTSWVFGAHGSNFLKTILRLAGERPTLRIVADQQGAPTGAALIAEVTATVVEVMHQATAADPRWGLYLLAAGGETSWFGYATHLLRRARDHGAPLMATPESLAPIATADYPTPARRPANSRLNTGRLRATFGTQLSDWTHGVDRVLEQLLPVQSKR